MNKRKNKILCLIGYTSCGKSSVEKKLVKNGYRKLVSHTTRAIRVGEVNGIDYNFIDKDKFHSMAEKGEFAESRHYFTFEEVDGEKKRSIWYYALSKQQIKDDSKPCVVVIDKNGAIELSKYVGAENLVMVYLECSDEVLRNRSKLRGDYSEEFERRLTSDKRSFKGIENMVHTTVNTEMELERVVESVKDVYDYYNGL